MKLQTPLCGLLGIQYPIFSVGFARAAVPELAAAVSNAGGCGVIGATNFPPPYVQERIQAVRNLTGKPFGANVILANKMRDETIDACLAVRIPLLVLFWGDPAPYVAEAHRRGTKVFIQAGSVEEAVAAADAGVDGVIAQGMEAGGHVKSKTASSIIVPGVVKAIKPTPVLASGGISIIGTSTWIDGSRDEISRYRSYMPLPVFQGDLDYASLWCGESVSLVNEIKPAGQIVKDIVREAEETLGQL